MGASLCFPSADTIERNTLRHSTTNWGSQVRVLVPSISSSEDSGELEGSPNHCTDKTISFATSEHKNEYGPSAISLNAVVTPKSSINKHSSSSPIKWRAPNSIPQSNTFPKFWRDQISNFTPTSEARTSTGSVSSTYDAVPMTKILPQLYLGSYDDAISELELQDKGITHILSLIGNKSPVDFVQHEIFPMHDRGRTDLKRVLEKVSRFVESGQKDGNCILVHCLSGQNRSAVLVIALMMKQNETLYCAHKKVKSLRPIVQINEGYAKQLLTLEKEIFGENTLPCNWMERGEFDITREEITYKYE